MERELRQRLQKILAQAGYGSRRVCEALIEQGRVTVNGQTAKLGAKVDPYVDLVEVDGSPISLPRVYTYILLHKPAGVVTTRKDPHASRTVMQLLPPEHQNVFPVGRLDEDTTGVLLLTNDGELAYRLTHPRYAVPKTYLAEVRGMVEETRLQQLREGVMLEDGKTALASAKLVRYNPQRNTSLIRLTLHEGRKRQAKRMCAMVGHPVVRLHRERFGPLTLRNLPIGTMRHLTAGEVAKLKQAVGLFP